MLFKNRKQAGQILGEKLLNYKNMNPLVLALPRGGVPVAAEIALALQAPLDVLIVRKIGAPFQPEVALGAICENENPVWNEKFLSRLGIRSENLRTAVTREKNKIRQQLALFRKGQPLPELDQKTVILVDDGLATGATMLAAVQFLKDKFAARIVIAVPVAATDAIAKIKGQVDDVVIQAERQDLISVGQWYEDFGQVSDDKVLSLLQSSNTGTPSIESRSVQIRMDSVDPTLLDGDLTLVPAMKAVIIFAHGSGSSRQSLRHQQVAKEFNEAGFGTLLFDLLSDSEAKNRANIFDITRLSRRLVHATRWLRDQKGLGQIPVAYFGASTGTGAALQAAAQLNDSEAVFAVVSRGGRPDLAGFTLKLVKTPTLLLVGGGDLSVLELNRQAQKFLSYSKLFVIPGATHLFEEPGAMDEVSKQAIQWFNQALRARKIEARGNSTQTLDEVIQREMIPIESEDDFDSLIEAIKNTRVVMLGEASHGTEEFYQLRRLISQRLIKDHGFQFIAVEGDWPDAYRLNKYIQTGEGQSAKQVLMHNHRWPTWMWANDEVVKLAEWMRSYRAGFYGLDVYSLFESIDEVVKYLKLHRPDLASEIELRYACFDLYEGDEISYARSLWKDPAGCESEVLLNLQNLLELRVQDVAQGADALFNSQQNARIVKNAEAYYRAMFGSDASSWNVRDCHMLETLDLLLDRSGEGAKAIVWAHNTHVGDYRATDMKDSGYINIGGLARQKYGADNVALVGFGTFQGSVLAGAAWGSAEQVMTLPMPPEESYEHHFHKAAVQGSVNQFYLLLEDKAHTPLAQKMGHRAIGVVYDPHHEKRGNYVPTELSKRYDAFVFVDQSHALKSLHIPFALGEFPETWPMGQ